MQYREVLSFLEDLKKFCKLSDEEIIFVNQVIKQYQEENIERKENIIHLCDSVAYYNGSTFEEKRDGLFQMADYVFIALFSKRFPKFVQNESLLKSIQTYGETPLKNRDLRDSSKPNDGYELFYDYVEKAAIKSYSSSKKPGVVVCLHNWMLYHKNVKMADRILDILNSLTLN